CDPQSPWQKGTVENTNGRVRKWLSREVDPLSISDGELRDICDRLNSTPAEVPGLPNARGSIPQETARAHPTCRLASQLQVAIRLELTPQS
ncbi:hypothetical protein EV130_1121, partial [Rhizobium azibense]